MLLHGEQQNDDYADCMEVAASSCSDHRLEHSTEIDVLLKGKQHAGNQEGYVEEPTANGSNHRLDSLVLAVSDVPPF